MEDQSANSILEVAVQWLIHSILWAQLKGQTISVPPPQNPRQVTHTVHKESNKSTDNDQASAREDESVPHQLPRTHVPPLYAPTQAQVVPAYVGVSQVSTGMCALWLICKIYCKKCGGHRNELCKFYGSDTGKIPSEAELAYQTRLRMWSNHMKMRYCAWYSYCRKAVECGDIRKSECSKFGTNGTHSPPPEDEFKKRKRKADAEKRQKQRSEKK